jgi:DNA-binding Lrp family transcriptional regulator
MAADAVRRKRWICADLHDFLAIWQRLLAKRQMDETDHKLIALLRRNARASVAELANTLGVSRGTVTNRMRRLEETRVIRGYTAVLRPGAEAETVRAWMAVQVEGNQTRKVVSRLMGEPGVASLHDTNGRWDLLAELHANSMSDLSQLLERIRLIRGIHATETSIHLTTFR